MPASPIVPAISPSNSDYFARSIKTTSAPLPQTADSITGVLPDDSAFSTPLTSISSSSFFVDSSASVAHTALSSIYSNSPPLSPSTHPTSRPDQGQISDTSGLQLRGILPTTYNQWSNTDQDTGPLAIFRSAPDLASSYQADKSRKSPESQATEQLESTSTIYRFPSQSRSSPSLIRVPQISNTQIRSAAGHQRPFDPFQSIRPHSSSSSIDHVQLPHWPNVPSQPQGTGAYPYPQSSSSQALPIPGNLPPNYRSSIHPLRLQNNLTPNLFGFPTGLQFGIQGNFLGTSIARDALLAYAHRLYNNAFNSYPPGLTSSPHQSEPDSRSPATVPHQQLLSLLDSIRSQHPHHLPTLLLLSCVQFSIGNYDACADVCNEILRVDGNYVSIK
jgi:hypothetical protein